MLKKLIRSKMIAISAQNSYYQQNFNDFQADFHPLSNSNYDHYLLQCRLLPIFKTGGGLLATFRVGVCRPQLQNGTVGQTNFYNNDTTLISTKMIPLARFILICSWLDLFPSHPSWHISLNCCLEFRNFKGNLFLSLVEGVVVQWCNSLDQHCQM